MNDLVICFSIKILYEFKLLLVSIFLRLSLSDCWWICRLIILLPISTIFKYAIYINQNFEQFFSLTKMSNSWFTKKLLKVVKFTWLPSLWWKMQVKKLKSVLMLVFQNMRHEVPKDAVYSHISFVGKWNHYSVVKLYISRLQNMKLVIETFYFMLLGLSGILTLNNNIECPIYPN